MKFKNAGDHMARQGTGFKHYRSVIFKFKDGIDTSKMKGFNSLELFFKKDFLSKSARFIISIRYYQYTVGLYSWNRFLFEQYYDHDKAKVTAIRLAANFNLEKFIKQIDISDTGLTTH